MMPNPNQAPVPCFVFRGEDQSLEMIAANVRPTGHNPTDNFPIEGRYIQEGNIVRPVNRLRNNQRAYKFPIRYVVFLEG